LYYKPGSLKARNCVEGRKKLYAFCRKYDISHEKCGKVVVATKTEEIPALDELERRGHANGLTGLKRLGRDQIKQYEPHIAGIGGLSVPETGIVDYIQVTNKFAELVMDAGHDIKLKTPFKNLVQNKNELVIETGKDPIHTHNLINCGGLQSDRIARACGMEPGLRIIPFRGEYYELKPEKSYLINNLVYPVPDPAFPFLGVHFTRMIHGGVEAGPNAVLAFKREGYNKLSFSFKDTKEILGYKGFLLLAAKFMGMGLGEFYRSFSKAAFVRALQNLLPEITSNDIVPGGAGVRAQALENSGKLVDDFRIVQNERMIHVLNAPSPAATASISIGEKIAVMAEEQFGLI
jgi:(S)-2-hydroxyglutarate dehydrogenase